MGDGPNDHPVASPFDDRRPGAPDLVRGGPQRIPRPPDWRLGDPPPWHDLPPERRHPTLDEVRENLADTLRRDLHPTLLVDGAPPERPSAVLVAVYEHAGEPHVLLTRRSWSLRAHGGEVSFPGGRAEDYDTDLVATALREAHEEVSISPETVEIVGRLEPLQTITSRSMIMPYVGLLPGLPDVEPDPREVEEIRHVALAELLSDEVYREEIWRRGEDDRPLWFFDLHGDTVWGATASMLRQFLALVTRTDRHRSLP